MNFVVGLIAIFLAINVINAYEMKFIDENEYKELIISGNINTTTGDIDRIWGSIKEDSIRLSLPFVFSMNGTVGTIAAINFTYRVSSRIDGIRLRSLNNTGAVGDIIEGGVGYDFAVFMLVGNSHFFRVVIESFQNYSSNPVPPSTTTTTQRPTRIYNEWGTINSMSRVLFPTSRFTVIANPGQTTQEIARVNASGIIDGVRLISFENSVDYADIVEGGMGYDYVILNIASWGNYLSCQIDTFENGTEITTMTPDYEVQHWGTVHGHSTLLSNNRHYYYPGPLTPADRRVTEHTEHRIDAMRLFALNGTRGAFALIEGGLGHNFVTFRFIGESLGRGFDFRLELYNNANSKRLSFVVIFISFLMYFFVHEINF